MATKPDRVAAVREFNRFYTRRVGALRDGLLDTSHPLPEARVLFELGRRRAAEVSDLRAALDLDAGYTSRLLASLEREGLVERERSPSDARRQIARLTKAGTREFRTLDRRSAREVADMLGGLRDEDQRRLVAAMGSVRAVLDPPARPGPIVLRPPARGDLGWVVHRHGVLFGEEFGWDETFEALIAAIVSDYVQGRDPGREAAWIAEIDGRPAGSIFCVAKSKRVARLRLLLVEPGARGLGLGARLVDECMRFARDAGYRELTLWTFSVLRGARRIYDRAGFELVSEDPPRTTFGRDGLVGQNLSVRL